jgi:hypothetical protein
MIAVEWVSGRGTSEPSVTEVDMQPLQFDPSCGQSIKRLKSTICARAHYKMLQFRRVSSNWSPDCLNTLDRDEPANDGGVTAS